MWFGSGPVSRYRDSSRVPQRALKSGCWGREGRVGEGRGGGMVY